MQQISRPIFQMINNDFIERIIDEAITILEKVGIIIENENALRLLGNSGVIIQKEQSKVLFSKVSVELCL